jgi:hypothetical protein
MDTSRIIGLCQPHAAKREKFGAFPHIEGRLFATIVTLDALLERLANWRHLGERGSRHGIGVYLYLNEPRDAQERRSF